MDSWNRKCVCLQGWWEGGGVRASPGACSWAPPITALNYAWVKRAYHADQLCIPRPPLALSLSHPWALAHPPFFQHQFMKLFSTGRTRTWARPLHINVCLSCWKKQLKLGFEKAGSWLTSSDQLPAQHDLAGQGFTLFQQLLVSPVNFPARHLSISLPLLGSTS